VVFAEGSYLKVSDYELTGDRVRLALPDGGVLTVALDRIERVVDDEVVRAPEPPPPALAEPVLQALFSPGQPVPATPFGSEIYAAAQRHAVNPVVVAAVVRAESAFDHRAVSVKGARGLMQLMPATARRFGLADHEILDPQRNLDAGVRYLRFLLDRFDGDLTLALAAYNAGEGTVDRYGGVPPYRETRGYIERIYATLGIRQPL
jgi:soluble lytic murein transglycosylase-like protein